MLKLFMKIATKRQRTIEEKKPPPKIFVDAVTQFLVLFLVIQNYFI